MILFRIYCSSGDDIQVAIDLLAQFFHAPFSNTIYF